MMTSKQIEEMMDAYDNKLADWAEKYSSLQMDIEQLEAEKERLVLVCIRGSVTLDKVSFTQDSIEQATAVGVVSFALHKVACETTQRDVFEKLLIEVTDG